MKRTETDGNMNGHKIEDFIIDIGDGKIHYDHEAIAAFLLDEEVLFLNTRKVVDPDGSVGDATIVLYVLCNDLFGPASDAESITDAELPELCRMYLEGDGVLRWVAKKRGIPAVRWRDMKREEELRDSEFPIKPESRHIAGMYSQLMDQAMLDALPSPCGLPTQEKIDTAIKCLEWVGARRFSGSHEDRIDLRSWADRIAGYVDDTDGPPAYDRRVLTAARKCLDKLLKQKGGR